MATRRDLATAIRAGARLRPSATGVMHLVDAGVVIGSCVLGAAYDGTFGPWTPTEDVQRATALIEEYPELVRSLNCPACDLPEHHDRSLLFIITRLNDGHGWDRERVASWVGEQR